MEQFRVSRNGKEFGPYTEADLRAYLASGNIVETDLVRSEQMKKWVSLKRMLPRLNKSAAEAARLSALRTDLPSPPDIPWWMAMILEVLTGLTFFIAWDIVQAVWLRRVEKKSIALTLYAIAAALFIINARALYSEVLHNLFHMGLTHSTNATWLSVATFIVRVFARFSMRKSLLQHFNVTEPIGLKLSWLWTLIFGGLYFQYHFNHINEMKRARAAAAVRV
jgi:hypothetical protein